MTLLLSPELSHSRRVSGARFAGTVGVPGVLPEKRIGPAIVEAARDGDALTVISPLSIDPGRL
jgi:hypothetical protein